MPRWTSSVSSPRRNSRYLLRRSTVSMVRPASERRQLAGNRPAQSAVVDVQCLDAAAATCGSTPRRVVSTSGSSGIAKEAFRARSIRCARRAVCCAAEYTLTSPGRPRSRARKAQETHHGRVPAVPTRLPRHPCGDRRSVGARSDDGGRAAVPGGGWASRPARRPTADCPPSSCTACSSATSRSSAATATSPRAPTSKRRATPAIRRLPAARPRSRCRRASARRRCRPRACGPSSSPASERAKQLVTSLASGTAGRAEMADDTAELRSRLERALAEAATSGASHRRRVPAAQPAARAGAGPHADLAADPRAGRALPQPAGGAFRRRARRATTPGSTKSPSPRARPRRSIAPSSSSPAGSARCC